MKVCGGQGTNLDPRGGRGEVWVYSRMVEAVRKGPVDGYKKERSCRPLELLR